MLGRISILLTCSKLSVFLAEFKSLYVFRGRLNSNSMVPLMYLYCFYCRAETFISEVHSSSILKN